ncbi:MAG: hypothetical protein ACI4KM_06955 [Oscillospiraceae bacterium]
MAVDVKSEYIDIGGQNVLLAAVRGGSAVIGTCLAGHTNVRGEISSVSRLFYMGTDPVVNLLCPNHGDKRSEKLIQMCLGYQGMDLDIKTALTESLTRLNSGESLESGLRSVLSLLSDGVYTIYKSEYYPTDGAGTFFWGAYNLSHEVRGSAEHNRTIGGSNVYKPCFLIPSEPLDTYKAKVRATADEAVKSRKVQGIVYHLSGLHSVLLKGHHGAASCVAADIPYVCAVIEKITEPYTEKPAPAPAPEPTAEGEPQPAPAVQRSGITGFRSASVKIPLEFIPRDMLKLLVEIRSEAKPDFYQNLLKKLSTVRRKTISNNVIPRPVHDKCELMPDAEMIESAYAVPGLSEGQLGALLSGETEYEGEIIISPNFYSSIVTACNYLQFTDERRFVSFALAILDNPELNATHEYIARRISRIVSRKIYDYFTNITANPNALNEKLLPIAERYCKDNQHQF